MTDELKAAYAEGFRAGSIEGHQEGVLVGISRALAVQRAGMRALEISAYGEVTAAMGLSGVVADVVSLFPQTARR